MKSLVSFSASFLIMLTTLGQNLVPNPSFEDYINCPLSVGGLLDASDQSMIEYWYSMQWTPDYMHECAGPGASNYPQDNAWGQQQPYDGEAYVSVTTKGNFLDVREYVAVELLSPLVNGESYTVSFYVSDADGGIEEDIDCVTNNLGVLFLQDPPYYWTSAEDNLSLTPQDFAHLNYSQVLDDSTGWTLVQGVVVADMEYTHIAIGNFYTDAETIVIQNGKDDGCLAMYYIDQVCVGIEGEECLLSPHVGEQNSSLLNIQIYPNPSSSLLKVKDVYRQVESLSVCNSQGVVQIQSHDRILDVSELASGYYTVYLQLKNQAYVIRKFTKI